MSMFYIPWKSVSVAWKSANQFWSEAWYELVGPTPTPTPTLPPSVAAVEEIGNGALDPSQTLWNAWSTKQKKKKKKIELTCIIGGIHFTQSREANITEDVHFELDRVNIFQDTLLSPIRVEVQPTT